MLINAVCYDESMFREVVRHLKTRSGDGSGTSRQHWTMKMIMTSVAEVEKQREDDPVKWVTVTKRGLKQTRDKQGKLTSPDGTKPTTNQKKTTDPKVTPKTEGEKSRSRKVADAIKDGMLTRHPRMTCFRCGSSDHMSRECKLPCINCGDAEHATNFCPKLLAIYDRFPDERKLKLPSDVAKDGAAAPFID